MRGMSSWQVALLILGLGLAGCNRQQSASQEPQPLMPEPTLAQTTEPAATTDPSIAAAVPAAEIPATSGEVGGPIQIQTALLNAGYYTGPIDGKIGPMTQASIKEFQTAQGLTADGKVGTKTWSALKAYLASQQSAPAQPAQ